MVGCDAHIRVGHCCVRFSVLSIMVSDVHCVIDWMDWIGFRSSGGLMAIATWICELSGWR